MIYRPMDTARFIELAMTKHGSLYDYSETVYTHNQKPVSFGCTRCGKKVTLLQAQSHLSPKKLCGCRTCNRSRKRICGGCGTVVPATEFHSNGKKCKGCKESALRQKRLATIRKHEKQCKECGVIFSGRDKVFCSNNCKRSNAENRLTYSCCHCGATVRKRSVSTARFQFCNKDCQRAFQNRVGYDASKKQAAQKRKSLLAKAKRVRCLSDQRKARSAGFEWWSLCKSQSFELLKQQPSRWDKRLASAASLIKKRFEPVFKLKSKKIWSWESKIARERSIRLKSKTTHGGELKWNNRIQQAAKNAHKRFSLKG